MNPLLKIGALYELQDYNILSRADILKAVAEEYELTPEDLINNKTRAPEYAIPRHVYAYLCRELTDFKLVKIGDYINKNHATIIHSVKSMHDYIRFDKILKKRVRNIRIKLKQRTCTQ